MPGSVVPLAMFEKVMVRGPKKSSTTALPGVPGVPGVSRIKRKTAKISGATYISDVVFCSDETDLNFALCPQFVLTCDVILWCYYSIISQIQMPFEVSIANLAAY